MTDRESNTGVEPVEVLGVREAGKAPWKLPAIGSGNCACLNCGPKPATADMEMVIAVGFGDAHVSRDGEEVYREPSMYHDFKPCTCDYFGYTDKACTVLCGTCGGSGHVEDPDAGEAEYWQFSDAEKLAAADPDHDWRVVLDGPLSGVTYQRHGPAEWLVVAKNGGFA
jgi:hypothetical protein